MRQAPTGPEEHIEDYSHLSDSGQALVRRFRERVVELVAAPKPRSILEVGCGQGWLLREIAHALPDATLVGVDIRAEAVDFARTLVPEADLRVADAGRLPFGTSEFDLVVCSEVLEHVHDPPAVIAQIDLVGNGHAVLSVPHEPWFWLANLLRGKYLLTLGNYPGHIHHWSGRGFERLLLHGGGSISIMRSFPWLIAEVKR